MPVTTQADDGDEPAGDGDGEGGSAQGAAAADPSTVCSGGEMADVYEIGDGDTLADVANRLGVSEAALQEANHFGDGGIEEFAESTTIWVPCVDNWPANVSFSPLVDPPVCPDDSIMGNDAVQQGDTYAALAASWGVTVDEITSLLEVGGGRFPPPTRRSGRAAR